MSKVEKLLQPEIETFRFDLRLPNELDPIIWSIFRKKSTCFDWPALERHHAISSVMSHHWWVMQINLDTIYSWLSVYYTLNTSWMIARCSKKFQKSHFLEKFKIQYFSTLTKYRTLQIDFWIEMIILNL